MSALTRRALFAGAMAAPVAAAALPTLGGPAPAGPEDHAYWAKVAALYDPPPAGVIQLENGHFGAMQRQVRLAYDRHILRVNAETTLYTRSPALGADLANVRAKVARLLGVQPDEIAFTRGGTESMQVLIGQYNRLRPGDAVLYADLDYDSMQTAMESLARTRGARVIRIDLPEPATQRAIVDAYVQALDRHRDVRMMLLTHLSHRTGLIPPVAEIVAMAKARDVDVLLDCGHALGQTPFSLRDMGVSFAGLNLHKWIGSPLGVGVVYVAKDRVGAIDPSPLEKPSERIDARVHTGTVNFATVLTVADAIDAHEAIGVGPKAARLRWLRDRWVAPMRDRPGIEVLTPDDPAMHAGITSFRLAGVTTMAANAALRKTLFDRHRIFAIERDGPAKGACIRISPSFVNTAADMDALVIALDALRATAKPA